MKIPILQANRLRVSVFLHPSYGMDSGWCPVTAGTEQGRMGPARLLEEVYEPYLIQQGYLHRTPRGRAATPAAYRHFGYTPSTGGDGQESFFDDGANT